MNLESNIGNLKYILISKLFYLILKIYFYLSFLISN